MRDSPAARSAKEKENEMPQGDGTGPRGSGSMTGRGMGYCAGYAQPGFASAGQGLADANRLAAC
jgi:hypothetical protein